MEWSKSGERIGLKIIKEDSLSTSTGRKRVLFSMKIWYTKSSEEKVRYFLIERKEGEAMSGTELLLFVSLLCLLALVRVMRRFLNNALVFWGLAILYGTSLLLIIWEWVIMTSSMTFYGEIVKESYDSLFIKGLAVLQILWSFIKLLCLGKLYMIIGNALMKNNSQDQVAD